MIFRDLVKRQFSVPICIWMSERMPKSEDDILGIIDRHFSRASADFIIGRGDDCAILKTCGNLAVSTDLFLEDVHFRRSYFTPEETGWKALAVNLSDLAATGALPIAFSLGLAVPKDIDDGWLDRFFKGLSAIAEKYKSPLSGGDLSSSDKIQICVTIFGNAPEKAQLARKVSQPGDAIFCVGALGLSSLGLEQLETNGRMEAIKNWPEACKAHLMPEPKIEEGRILAKLAAAGLRIGLMDISDGLARDLPRLLKEDQGADLHIARQNIPAELLRSCELDENKAALKLACGGEDYGLLGSCPSDSLPELKQAIPDLWKIGVANKTGKLFCNGVQLVQGFDHFAKDAQ